MNSFQEGSKMKKCIVLLLLTALLAGCGAKETFESVEDVIPVAPVHSPQQFYVSLPDAAATPTFQDDSSELYVYQNYTISKQILESGDMEKTIQTLTGQPSESLDVIKTFSEDCDRYDFVWTAAGEEGLQVGRACILDDGNYHYALTTMAKEESAGELRDTLQGIFESCKLLDPDVNLSTGS